MLYLLLDILATRRVILAQNDVHANSRQHYITQIVSNGIKMFPAVMEDTFFGGGQFAFIYFCKLYVAAATLYLV